MNVLCHGYPFCCDETPLRRYRGQHAIRSFGVMADADYPYIAGEKSLPALLDEIERDWPVDLILFWTPEMYPPPADLERVSARTVACVSDWNVYFPRLAVNLSRYDLGLTDRAGVKVFSGAGVHARYAMPLYSHISEIHRPIPSERDIDVIFLGNLNPSAHAQRCRFLERLALFDADYRIVIAEGVDLEDYAKLMNRARIVFNHSIRGELNLRVFESLACGAMAMIERENLEAFRFFEDGVDIVCFDDDNFESVLRHYLDHHEECERIASAGQARALEWAGENRFDALIEFCMSNGGARGRAFVDLPDTEQVYQNWLQYVGSRDPALIGLEREFAQALRSLEPNAARSWTAYGNLYLRSGGVDEHASAQPAEAARCFYEAHRADRTSAPYALNAASAFAATGRPRMVARCLEACLEASGLAGADLLFGNAQQPFWTRWIRALAEGRQSLAMLHGEAHVRLAEIDAANGRLDSAESHLHETRKLDPENVGGDRLQAEIYWATARKSEAVDFLIARLPGHPLNREMRVRIVEMLRELGRTTEAERISLETELMFSRIVNRRPGAIAP